MATELPHPQPLDRRDRVTALILAALALAAGYWWSVGGICGIYHDDAIYVTTAKALAEGQGYRLINLPAAPWQTKYPILYPALLALIWKLWPSFPDNLWAMQALSLLAGAAVAGLAYLYLVRFGYFTRGVALAAGLLGATSINFLYFATLILSEIPFALLLLAALWALEEQARAPRVSGMRQLLLGILLGLPFLCRTIGITLVPVGLFVLNRQRQPLRWTAAAAAALILSWLLWTIAASIYFPKDHITGYYTDYLTWWRGHGFPSLIRVLVSNLFVLTGITGSLGVPGLDKAASFLLGPLVPVALFLVLGIITWIAVANDAGKRHILPLYLMSYFLITGLWPWPPFRFLVPVLPLLLAYLISAIATIKSRISFLSGCRPAMIAGLGLLLAANLALVGIRGQVHRETRYPMLAPLHPPVHWASYEAVFDWVKSHTAPDDVIAAGFDTMIYLYTGRPAFRPFVGSPGAMFYGDSSQPLGNPEDLLRVLRAYRARYLVHTPIPDFSEDRLFPGLLKNLIQKYPGVLQPVFTGKDERFVIFAVGPS